MIKIEKEILLEKHGSPCPYCSRKMDVHSHKLRPTKDHIRPKSRFKQDGQVIIVCSECNFHKGDMTIEEYMTALVAKNLELEAIMEVNNQRLANLECLFKMGLK
jgi:hypothetical protein